MLYYADCINLDYILLMSLLPCSRVVAIMQCFIGKEGLALKIYIHQLYSNSQRICDLCLQQFYTYKLYLSMLYDVVLSNVMLHRLSFICILHPVHPADFYPLQFERKMKQRTLSEPKQMLAVLTITIKVLVNAFLLLSLLLFFLFRQNGTCCLLSLSPCLEPDTHFLHVPHCRPNSVCP